MRRAQGQGSEHRYLVAHRYVTAARAVPPPYPNPRAEFREGGPDGTHWYHGTDVPFEGPLRAHEKDYGHASTNDTHWNTDLGVHFASSHDLARAFARNFAGTDSATPEHARIAHVSLHMRNPADFENEHALADHAIRTARKHGLHYGDTDDPELKDINDGYEDEVDLAHKDHWINSHPHREQIVHHVEDDLKKAGHDGIVYTNDYEGPAGQKSAIAFRDTPVTIHHWEHLHEGHPRHGRTATTSIYGSASAVKPNSVRPLYHGTSYDMDAVRPADEHGNATFDGLTRTDRAYATRDPQMARTYAEISALDTGRRGRVYEVEHHGPGKDLEQDPGYDADVMSPHGFRVLREVPEHELERMDRHGRTAGKGKPRRDAPDVARRAEEAGQGGPQDVATDGGGDADRPLKGLAEHPKVAGDLKKLPKQIQAAYRARVDDLRRGNPHSSTHALSGPLKGWQSTSLNFQYRVVHRNRGDELHVLSAGNHDESYDQGARRTASIRMVPPEEFGKFSYPDYPSARTPSALVKHFKKTSPEYYHKIRDDVERNGFTTPVLVRWKDGGGRALKKPQVMEGHHRAAVAHELGVHLPVGDYDDNADYDEAFRGGQDWFRQHARPNGDMPGKEGRYTAPHERLFNRTYGLDKRLWEGDRLKKPIRADIMATFDAFCARHGLVGHERWSKIVFFGSEASMWSGPGRIGNNDFDLSIGVDYPVFRRENPRFAAMQDQEIASMLTEQMHRELNDPQHYFEV